jgi:hypothetical protein
MKGGRKKQKNRERYRKDKHLRNMLHVYSATACSYTRRHSNEIRYNKSFPERAPFCEILSLELIFAP